MARLQQLLEPRYTVFACAAPANVATVFQAPPAVHLIVIDLGSFAERWRSWLRAAARACPSARILAIDVAGDVRRLAAICQCGAHGFVAYSDLDPGLDAALARLLGGDLAFPDPVVETLARRTLRNIPASAASAGLTEREAEVLDLVVAGLSNKEIAAELDMSERTARFHLANAFPKLAVQNRHAAAEAMVAINSAHGQDPSAAACRPPIRIARRSAAR